MNLFEIYKELNEKGQIVLAENRQLPGVYFIKYQHAGVDFSNPYTRMAYGLNILEDGTIISRGFPKFFNHNQLEHYITSEKDGEVFTVYNKEDNKTITSFGYTDKFKEEFARLSSYNDSFDAIEKKDGSFIGISHYQGEFFVNTKGSSNSEKNINPFVSHVLEMLSKHPRRNEVLQYIIDNNVTMIFEFVSPKNEIVVKYDKEDIVLLACIKNQVELEELNQSELNRLAKELGFSRPKQKKMTLDELIKYQREAEGEEGYIVFNKYGNRIKFKTDYWFNAMKGMKRFQFDKRVTKSFRAQVVDYYLNEQLDDFYSYLSNQTENQEQIEAARNIEESLNNLIKYTNQTLKIAKEFSDRKELAIYLYQNIDDNIVVSLTLKALDHSVDIVAIEHLNLMGKSIRSKYVKEK